VELRNSFLNDRYPRNHQSARDAKSARELRDIDLWVVSTAGSRPVAFCACMSNCGIMSDKCGAETTDGTPCENPAESCPWHDVDKQPDTGRPTKLSYERQEKIAESLENGKSISIAARRNDVSPKTVTNWAEKGEADLEQGKENEYTEFFRRFRRALGYKEDWYWKTIMDLARENGDHRFIMSMLKNEFPDEWGDTETGVDSDTIELNITEDVASTFPE